MKKKHKTIAVIAFFIVLFSAFFLHGYFMNKKAEDNFKNNQKYYGIIMNIEDIDGNRGLPKIRVGNNWFVLGMGKLEYSIATYIKVGDSISKSPGENIIKVYRRNKFGHWEERIFP